MGATGEGEGKGSTYSGGATSSGANASGAAGSAAPAASSNAKVVAAASLIAKLDAELDLTQGKDLEWRRQHFKSLLLKWHPDKNRRESPEQASEVFRHLMSRRGTYPEA